MNTELRQGMYVVSPTHSGGYITKGRKYKVLGVHISPVKIGFSIIDDEGDTIICRLKGCRHIGGLDWEIAE